jgi:serine/threonine protein kinase
MTMPTETPEPELLAGRYEIVRDLGRGGMADVLLAKDLNLQRQVAIKILRQELIDDPAFRVRFLQEARSAANLVHPNIVTVFDFGHDADRYFIVMEYVEGTELKTLIRRRGPLPVDDAVQTMIQICAGVGYAHRAGLVHCDLKPQNILITSDGRAKITDFGIARALAAIDAEEHTDIVWGSPQYFAPEQAAGGPPSPASDVYALGVILFEMLTGELPFEAADPTLLGELHQVAPPPSLRSLNPAVPASVEQIVFKVLSKEPSARYRTADQLGRVLETFAVPNNAPPIDPIPHEAAIHPAHALTTPMPSERFPNFDWLGVTLGLLALLAVGGLIPLWLFACLLYPTCPITVP